MAAHACARCETASVKNQHVICRLRSARIGENCALGLEHGPRPAALGCTQDLGAQFFPIRTSWPANNINIYLLNSSQVEKENIKDM